MSCSGEWDGFINSFAQIVDTVSSTVDSTKTAAQSAVETGKTYVDSAKGNLLFFIYTSASFITFERNFSSIPLPIL